MATYNISVEPKSSLIDEKIDINLSGGQPNQKITLQATLTGDKGQVYQSHAHYITDEHGHIDVCTQPSMGGNYTGVEPMGLLWSMKPAPGQMKGLRLMKTDVTTPYNIVLNCFDGHLSISDEESSQPLSSATFQKWYKADGVKIIPVKEGRIRGILFLPEGDGPFPGVMHLYGGAGALVEFEAALLASRGFAALAVAGACYDDLPAHPDYFEIDYFEEAAKWLSTHPKVLPHGIGVISICSGTWIALLLASLNISEIRTVVAISPLAVANFVPFSYKGKMSEVLPPDGSKKVMTEDGLIMRHAMPSVNEDNGSDSKYSAITPTQNISCPILLIYGTDDLNSNSEFVAKQIFERMTKQGKGNLCSILCYPNAGHLIEPPYSPLCYAPCSKITIPYYGHPYLVMGGETTAHARAQEDSWPKVLAFLRQNISAHPKIERAEAE